MSSLRPVIFSGTNSYSCYGLNKLLLTPYHASVLQSQRKRQTNARVCVLANIMEVVQMLSYLRVYNIRVTYFRLTYV